MTGCQTRDHRGAEHLGKLDRGDPHTAAGAGHQDSFSGLNLGAIQQGEIGGLKSDPERGCLVEGNAVGKTVAVVLRNHGLFGECTAFDLHHDPIAGGDVGHTGADRGNDPGAFLARHEGQYRPKLIFSLDGEQIGEINGGGMDIHQDFSRSRIRGGHFLQTEVFRLSQLLQHPGRACKKPLSFIVQQPITSTGSVWR